MATIAVGLDFDIPAETIFYAVILPTALGFGLLFAVVLSWRWLSRRVNPRRGNP